MMPSPSEAVIGSDETPKPVHPFEMLTFGIRFSDGAFGNACVIVTPDGSVPPVSIRNCSLSKVFAALIVFISRGVIFDCQRTSPFIAENGSESVVVLYGL